MLAYCGVFVNIHSPAGICAIALMLASISALVACGNANGRSDESAVRSAVGRAEAQVGFEIVLPTYLPPGVVGLPDVIVTNTGEVTIRYLPRRTAGTSDDLLLEVVEANEPYTQPEFAIPPVRQVDIGGIPVALQRTDATETSLLGAFYTGQGLSYVVSLQWWTASRWNEDNVESELRRVIESLMSAAR